MNLNVMELLVNKNKMSFNNEKIIWNVLWCKLKITNKKSKTNKYYK
mgnify:CR=1 FL=1